VTQIVLLEMMQKRQRKEVKIEVKIDSKGDVEKNGTLIRSETKL